MILTSGRINNKRNELNKEASLKHKFKYSERFGNKFTGEKWSE